jgi:hypothetical protein
MISRSLPTISAVAEALDTIAQQSAIANNRIGYFAALYKRMTLSVAGGITAGAFEDGPRMEQLVIGFAERYLQAHESFLHGRPVPKSWDCALSAADNRQLIVLQHLLLGINTHVNLDLAIAAASLHPGAAIHSLEKDFNHINVLIAALVDDVQKCLEEVWFPMRFFRNVINRQGTAVLNFSMAAARKTAWANAVLLAGTDSANWPAHIRLLDDAVCAVGNRIQHPGFFAGILLRFVRLTEWDDVARTIRLIDTTVVEEK